MSAASLQAFIFSLSSVVKPYCYPTNDLLLNPLPLLLRSLPSSSFFLSLVVPACVSTLASSHVSSQICHSICPMTTLQYSCSACCCYLQVRPLQMFRDVPNLQKLMQHFCKRLQIDQRIWESRIINHPSSTARSITN